MIGPASRGGTVLGTMTQSPGHRKEGPRTKSVDIDTVSEIRECADEAMAGLGYELRDLWEGARRNADERTVVKMEEMALKMLRLARRMENAEVAACEASGREETRRHKLRDGEETTSGRLRGGEETKQYKSSGGEATTSGASSGGEETTSGKLRRGEETRRYKSSCDGATASGASSGREETTQNKPGGGLATETGTPGGGEETGQEEPSGREATALGTSGGGGGRWLKRLTQGAQGRHCMGRC